MEIKIDRVKLSKVQRFLWDLSEKAVFDKFEFTESLSSQGSIIQINANRTDAHLLLARRCFTLLLDEPRQETNALCEYAWINIFYHLYCLDHADSLEFFEKEDLVDDIVNLLQSADCIERHLTREFFSSGAWLSEQIELKTIQTWICESEATDKLQRKNSSWAKMVKSKGSSFALKGIATMVTRHWLCLRAWSAGVPFQWIDTYLDRVATDEAVDNEKSALDEGSNSDVELKQDETQDVNGATMETPMIIRDRVERAARWAEEEAGLTKNSLWYERLGKTYLYYEEVDLAKEAFSKSKFYPDCSWEASEGLAEAHALSGQLTSAIQEMEIVLAHLRAVERLTEDQKAGLVDCLVKFAEWQTQLKHTTDATEALREAIRLDEHYYQSHYRLLKILVDTKQEPEALNLLADMESHSAKDGILTQLGSMLLNFCRWGGENALSYFETVLEVVAQHEMSHTIVLNLESALKFAQESQLVSHEIDLLLCRGVALARHSKGGDSLELALDQWARCFSLGFHHNENSENEYSAYLAARYVFNCHFSKARSGQGADCDFESHETKIKGLLESTVITPPPYSARKLRLMLGSFYTLSGKREVAQNLLLNDMKIASGLLSDDDPENDDMGYGGIANILMHTGDDLNAMTAWSLYGPSIRYKQDDNNGSEQLLQLEPPSAVSPPANESPSDASTPGDPLPSEASNGEEQPPIKAPPADEPPTARTVLQEVSPTNEEQAERSPFSCDGRCGKLLTYADSLWFCKVCDDVQFEDECMQKLHQGTLARYVCSPDHEWLRVPSWTDEYRATGKGHVRMGGDLQDGKRVGGQIVPIEEWLGMIREKWGIEKPTKVEQPKESEQEDASEELA